MVTSQLNEAKENLNRIKKTYKNEPMLLNFYLPTAEYLVKMLETGESK